MYMHMYSYVAELEITVKKFDRVSFERCVAYGGVNSKATFNLKICKGSLKLQIIFGIPTQHESIYNLA